MNELTMAANQPPSNTTRRDAESKIQRFLEQAAPIVLESRVLDAGSWEQLVALARELELSDDQLRATIEDLRRRGVIQRVELQQAKPPATAAPKPPPLPTRSPHKRPDVPPAERPSADSPTSDQPATAPGPQPDQGPQPVQGPQHEFQREKTFSLNSPNPPQPPPPPPLPKPPGSAGSERPVIDGANDSPDPARPRQPSADAPPVATPPPAARQDATGPHPLPRSDRPRTGGSSATGGHLNAGRRSREQRREQLSQRAAAILAEQRGFSPKTHSLISAAAEDLGLGDSDVAAVMRALAPGDRPPQESPSDEASQRRRWKEAGKPEPPRHEAPKKPHEIFTEFVATSLDKLAVGHISRDLESGLVAHGTKVLKLSHVYASQLVREVADQKKLLLESVTQARLATPEDKPQDPLLATFLDRAAPILAQNRGLNARSRVLLGAMAEEIGLPANQVDAAVAQLESKPSDADGQSVEQQARMAPFRTYAGEMLGQLPQPILTARVHSMLLERAEERFGLDAEQARGVLRELATAQSIQIVTEAEALDHLEGLVSEHLGDALRLDSSIRQRILKEGGQWGLTPGQVEQVIKKLSRRNYKKRQSERNLSNAALVAAMVAVLLVVGFLGWAMMGGRMTPVEPGLEPAAPEVAATETSAATDASDDRWWSVELVLAVHNATVEFPLLRRTLKAIGSPDPAHRASAYETIIRQALQETDDTVQRNILLNVVSQAYVVEPDDATATQIRRALVGAIPGPEDRLSERADDYRAIFWAMRGAVLAMHAAAEAPERADAMASAVGDVVGTTIDREQPLLSLERQCLGALAERLFHLMIASAESRPADALPLHHLIVEEAGRYLDPARVDGLNAEFLAALLQTSGDAWRDVQPLIDTSTNSKDPLIIAKMIDIFETTENGDLRTYLQNRLVRRTNVKPDATDPRDIAGKFREALGIIEEVTAEGRTLDFMQLARRDLDWTSEAADERIQAAESATRLSRVATLGCALAQGELGHGTFDTMIKRGPPDLEASLGEDDDPFFPTEIGTDWDAVERLNSALGRLQREGSAKRVERLESVAAVAGRVADLDPSQANLLAAYLVARKPLNEHTKILERVAAFRHWPQLHLAIADQLETPALDLEKLQATVSELLDEPIRVDDSAESLQAVRGALLRRALTKLAATGSAIKEPQRIDRARRLLFDQYVRQANLLGVPQPTFADAAGPAAVLRAIIQHYAAGLLESGPTKDVERQLNDVPHQLQAVDYMATNPLQQTVLLERIWLQLLAAAVTQRSPQAAGEAQHIIGELQQADRSATHSLGQLRASQAAIVQMWMLWNRPK